MTNQVSFECNADWIKHGIRYLGCPALHEIVTLERVPEPVLSVIRPSEVVLLIVLDTVYPVHKYLLSTLSVCERKLHYNDTFKATLWNIQFDAMTLDIPAPYSFHLFLTRHVYGCRCDDCAASYRYYHAQYFQVLNYLSGGLN